MTVTYYLGSVLDVSVLTTASDVSITSGGSGVGFDTPLGTLTGYGELCPHGAPATWPALGSESAVPASGHGNIYPVSLANQIIPSANWTPTLRLSVVGTGPSAITADIIFRAWKYNSSSLTYTKIGIVTLSAQTIGTSATTFNLTATSLAQAVFGTNEYAYFDVVSNVTSNPNGSGVNAKIRCNFSNSATLGNATAQVIAPSTVAYRGVPLTAALSGTFTRTVPGTASLAFTSLRTIGSNTASLVISRAIPLTAALTGSATRTITCTASVCRGPLAVPYVPYSSNTNYVTASGTHIQYRGATIKLYGTTIYLSTQGGTQAWRQSITATLDTLFYAAWSNGMSMIRITDYWDSSTSGQTMDDPGVWANIDYCVTKAASLGMFVMMDVSGFKALLTSQGQDPTIAANWTDFLTYVGLHYRNTAPSICWYNLSGEPSLPVDQASTDALAAFYTSLCNTMYTADNGTHLISSGGLTHMNSVVPGISYPAWWYPIFTIATNSILSVKNYSVNDLTYMSTMSSILTSNSITKPISMNEFGAQQEQGDLSFPTFTNTLSAGITAGATVTSLSLATPISRQVVAGTIISVSSTENYVVATTTSSGTSLAVQSVTASSNHSIGDSVSALGFADVPHSLADTVVNFYKAVIGLSTTLLKWNNTPRTVVATSVPGGDQLGMSSYVAWNLGYQVQGTGYDLSRTVSSGTWQVYGNKAFLDGYRPSIPHTLFAQVARRTGAFPSAATRRTGTFATTKRRMS